MLRLLVAVPCLTIGVTIGFGEDSADQPIPPQIDFNEHIRPIFTQHCTACHGGVKQAGDVSFVYREQVLPPDGWIVEPGDPDASVLIERVVETDPELRMPPPDHGKALSKHEIKLLTDWVRQGARWEASHWSYAKPVRPAIPTPQDTAWARGPIDQFVRSRMESEGLVPSADAAPDRWLRRVTLGLTGLPPTPQERVAFLNHYEEDSEKARAQTVDRLLDSPEFGERWASVWLDQIRYSDSKGLGLDGRRSIWKYRDWVIDALNKDLPYDQFTIKQIAGDLLEAPSIGDLIATAAHRTTQSNEEGGTDDEEFRIAAVLDRVNTTWQAWQGVTFGCVQCHNHPYDPFRHDEYYQFAAFFNNTADCDLDQEWPIIQAPLDTSQYPLATKLDRQIDRLRLQIWDHEYKLLADSDYWHSLINLEAATNNATRVAIDHKVDHDEYHTVDTVSKNTDITLTADLPENLSELTAVRLTALPLDPEQAISDSEWGFVLSEIDARLVVPDSEETVPIAFESVIADEPNPFYDPNESLNGKTKHGFASFSRIHYPRQAAFVLKSPMQIPGGARIQLTLKHRVYILASFSLLTRRAHVAVSDDPAFTALAEDDVLKDWYQSLKAVQKRRSSIKSASIPILRERESHLARPTHVFQRGLFLDKADQVSPATPSSLHDLKSATTPDRMDLARWIVSPENPLTARVAVNRLWARLFGIGIVATEEDFGSSGEPPSHPALLDHLAIRFQTDLNWSVKGILREIVLSRTYGQASAVTPAALKRDPQNRLLTRGPRFRLPAEIVRDQSLAFAGLLSKKQFGPPVHPPIPAGVWNPFHGGDKWTKSKPGDENRYRRSIYTYMKRSIPYPMFSTFDAPSREFCTPRRLRSNTPLQALMMLNDQTLDECAEGLAKRMANSDADLRQQIRHGWAIVTAREATEDEINDLVKLYQTTQSDEQDDHAMKCVAGVLLNLDEVVMK